MTLVTRPSAIAAVAAAWLAALSTAHVPARMLAPGASSPRGEEGPQLGFSDAVDRIAADALRSGVRELVVAVDVGGERVLSRGWGGPRHRGRTPDGDTAFHAGPLLDPLLALAALRLADEGGLDLDASLGDVLPDLPYGKLGVRVDQLLTHTSGIPDYGDLEGATDDQGPDVERILAWLREGPLDSQPGSCAAYSATDELLLGLVLQANSGRDVHALLEQEVFERAGMTDTSFDPDPAPPDALPVEQEFRGSFEVRSSEPPFGARRLVSTAHDLLKLQRALVDGGLLSEEALERLASAPRLKQGDESPYARGFSLSRLGDYERRSAGGGLAGQRVQLDFYPALDATLVVWAGGEAAPVQQIGAQVARELFALEQPVLRDLPLAPAERARYFGDYYVGCTSYLVAEDGEHLVLRPPSDRELVLLYQGDTCFVARDDPEIVLVFELEDGEGVALVLTEHGVSVRARRLY